MPAAADPPSPATPVAENRLLRRRGSGQASVELVALLPALALVIALVFQCALAGHATWAAGAAARAAARAHALGGDPSAAARRRLPVNLERGVVVRELSDGSVRVAVRVPTLIPALALGTAAASAHFADQGA